MTDYELLERITARREIFGGKPIIGGIRISVEQILSLLSQAEMVVDILVEYPDLEPEDNRACLYLLAPPRLPAERVIGQASP